MTSLNSYDDSSFRLHPLIPTQLSSFVLITPARHYSDDPVFATGDRHPSVSSIRPSRNLTLLPPTSASSFPALRSGRDLFFPQTRSVIRSASIVTKPAIFIFGRNTSSNNTLDLVLPTAHAPNNRLSEMPVSVVPREVVQAVEGRQGVDFATAVPKCPPTAERPQATDIDAIIDRPSVARANLAVSTEQPQGSPEYVDTLNLEDYTVLQQHVMFWDRDDDGQIWPQDTFMGFYELGFNLFFCALATLIINLNFSYPTRLAYSYFPDPFFRVYVPSIHKAKHGSDSGTYDKEGRFIPQAFEDLFSKFDRGNKAALSAGELWNIMSTNRVAVDPFGWFASVFEFGVTFLLVQKDGKVDKEDLRRIYDGSIFWKIRDAYRSDKGWNKGFGFREFFNLGREELAKNRSRFPLLDGVVSQVEKTFPHKLRKA